MSIAQHTPGPFEAKVATASTPTMHIHTPRGVVASVYGARHVRDAQLFAAAAELLAAGEKLLKAADDGDPDLGMDAYDDMRAAIAKAKGGAA